MQIKQLLPVVALVAFAVLCHAAQARKLQEKRCPGCIKSIVVFGDSLSDAGLPYGIWSLDNKTIPLKRLGYNNGRYTNKKVWCEILAKDYGLDMVSFAIGGATVNNVTGTLGMVINQLNTYKTYLATHTMKQPNLAVVMAGSNDFLKLTPAAAANIIQATAFMRGIVAGIGAIAQTLIAQGQKNIVISNLPPIELTPYGKLQPAFSAQIAFAVKLVNEGINQTVAVLSKAAPNGTRIVLYDMYKSLKSAIEDPARYSLENSSTNCLVTNSTSSGSPNAVLVSVCKNPDSYLFWDMLHPASGGHKGFALTFSNQLKKSGMLWSSKN